VTGQAFRGGKKLLVESTVGLSPGMWVRLVQVRTPNRIQFVSLLECRIGHGAGVETSSLKASSVGALVALVAGMR
jgi:hypothetical protein